MPTRLQYQQYLQLPHVRAALDTIAWAEGGGYNILFGGGTFGGNQHPNNCIPYLNTCSTAAGRYQFLYRTWIEIKNRLGLPDFSRENQDIAALDLINQRGQLQKLLNGDLEGMMRGLGCAWAALPFNGRQCSPAQRERPLAETLAKYRSFGGGGSGSPSTPVYNNNGTIINAGNLATVDIDTGLNNESDNSTLYIVGGLLALALIL